MYVFTLYICRHDENIVVAATALDCSVLVRLLCVLLTAAAIAECSKEVIERNMCGLTLFSVYLCPAKSGPVSLCVSAAHQFRVVPNAPAVFPLFGCIVVLYYLGDLPRQKLALSAPGTEVWCYVHVLRLGA